MKVNYSTFKKRGNKLVFVKQNWILFALGVFSLFTTINLQYIGEEGVYTITSFEMWLDKELLQPLLFGGTYPRPPLYNWLIIFIANFTGWEHQLVASRIVAIISTVSMGLVLWWFVDKIYENKNLASFILACFLTGDLLFRRGWLAYSDPVFSLFSFSSMALLILSAYKNNLKYLMISAVALSMAFLSKALTCYYSYFSLLFVLCLNQRTFKFLVNYKTILIYLIAVLFPVFWFYLIGDLVQLFDMIKGIFLAQGGDGELLTLKKILTYPFLVSLWFFPLSFFCLYGFVKNKYWVVINKINLKNLIERNQIIWLVSLVLLLNILPIWFSPRTQARYIMPIYPFFTFIFAYNIYKFGFKYQKITLYTVGTLIAIRYLAGILWFPYYQSKYRTDFSLAANEVIADVKDDNVFIIGSNYAELSLASSLNQKRINISPVKSLPFKLNEADCITLAKNNGHKGYVLTRNQNKCLGHLVKNYNFGRYIFNLYKLDSDLVSNVNNNPLILN